MRNLKLPNAFSLLQSKRKWVLAYVFNSKTFIFKESVYKDLLHKTICLYNYFSAKLNEENIFEKYGFKSSKKAAQISIFSHLGLSTQIPSALQPSPFIFRKSCNFFSRNKIAIKNTCYTKNASLCALLLDQAVT